MNTFDVTPCPSPETPGTYGGRAAGGLWAWVHLVILLGCAMGSQTSARGQTAFFEFAEQTFHVSEEAGTAHLDVRRWGNTTISFTVEWLATAGTSTAGVDFTVITNTLVFASGETNKTVTLPVRDDGVLEEAETVSLRFGAASAGASTGLVNYATLVIHDNEAPSLVDPSFKPSLGPNNDVFAILLQPDGRLVVGGEFTGVGPESGFIPRPGVARFLPDGSLDPGFVTGDGVHAGVYALALQPDGKLLLGGGFNTNANNSRRYLSRLNANGSLDATFVATVDDEIRGLVVQPDGKILIAGRFTKVNGQDRGRIARLHADGTLDATFLGGLGADNHIRVLVRQSDGRLLIGGQFTSYDGVSRVRVARLEANGVLDPSFNPGSGANGQVRAIAPAADGRIYLGGEFTTYDGVAQPKFLRVLSGGGIDSDFRASLGGADAVRSLLVQPDGRVLVGGAFGAAWGKVRSNFERCLTNGAPDPTLLSDHGPDNEVFALALQPDGSIVIGGQFREVASVARPGLARLLPDSRVPMVEYAAGEFVAAETSTQASILVRRTGESSNAVTVTCFTAPGTAVAGSDFAPVTNILQFAPLQITRSFSVPVFNEGGMEPPETVHLLLSAAVGAGLGAWGEAQLVLLDGFGSGPLQLHPPNLYEPGEGAGFLVVRTGPLNLPLLLHYSTRDGTARAGADYEPASGTFQLAAGESSGYIQVRPLNDSLQEGPETFSLDLRETPGGPVVVSSSVTIGDNELGLGLVSTETTVLEDVGSVTFYVQCQWDPTAPVEVDFTTRSVGTAAAGLDYAARAGTLIFQKDGEVRSITVPILNDGRVEGVESFRLLLTALRGPVRLGETNALITVIDNDEGIEFVTNSASIGENESRVTLAVRRRDDGGNTVTVEYATADDQAIAGTDYSPANGTLILPPGPGERTFTVPVLDDAWVETDETFRVFLRNPTAGASVGARASAVVRLLDNERPGSLETWFNRPRPGPSFHGGQAKITLQPDGKILASGGGTLLRFNTNGEIDTNFNTGQVFFGAFVPMVQPDGRVIVGATSSNSLGENQCVFRLLTNGVLDPSFDSGLTFGRTAALALQPDGRIFAGGNFDAFSWEPQPPSNGLLRLRPDGSIDPTFNAGTFLPRGAYYESPTTVEALALQPDGRILAAGKFHRVSGRACDRIIRLNTDGTFDPTFFCDNAGAATNDAAVVLALALQPDGKILAGGHFTTLQGAPRNGLIRLGPDGRVDPGFQAPFGSGVVVHAIELQPDGKILVGGGNSWWPGDSAMNFVVRLRPDGTLDETFDPGLAPNGAVTDLALLPDGDVLVAGGFTVFNGVPRPGLVRLNGGSFAYSRLALTPATVSLVEGAAARFEVQRSGETNWTTTIEFMTVPGTATAEEDFALQHLTLTFAPGERWKTIEVPVDEDGRSESDEVFRVALSNPGGGATVLLQSTAEVTVLDQDRPASVDGGFLGSTDPNSEVQAILVQADGKILMAGSFTQVNGQPGPGYARLNPDGTPDNTFQRGTDSYDTTRALVRAPDGRLLIGGDFKTVLGQPRIGIARLLENGAVDPSFQSALDDLGALAQSVGVIALVGEKIVIGGEFSRVGGQERLAIARLLSNGQLDPTFHTPGGVRCGWCGFAGNLTTLAPLPNGQILIGGGFNMVQGQARRYLARLNSDGALDGTFPPGPGPNGPVTAIVPLANGQLYVAGGFTTISGESRSGIVLLEPDGSVSAALPQVIGTDDTVSALTLQPDGRLLIGGYFQNVNGVPRARVARLHPDLTLDQSFDPGVTLERPSAAVSALALEADGGVLIGGHFSLEPLALRFNVARLRGWFEPWLDAYPAPGPARVGLTLFTQPGETYILQASTDLRVWIPVQTNVASGTVLTLSAPGFPAFPQRFYRAVQSGP